MKNWHLFIAVFLILSLSGKAQSHLEAQIEWGPEYSEPSGTFLSKIVATQGGGFYALREKTINALTKEPTKIFVEYYDSRNMKLLKSREIDLRYKGKKRQFEQVIMLGKKLYLLTSFHNEAKKKNYLFTQRIDNKTLNLDKEMSMIGEIETRSIAKEGSFDYHISQDSSKLLIINKLPYKKSEPERFDLRVFDDGFKEIWQKDIALPYNDENFSIEEYRVDDEGNVYLLGVLYTDRTRVRYKGKPNYQYIILSYPKDGGKGQQYKIELGEQFITDLTFRIANNGRLICSGFYSEKGTYSIQGTYFFQIDPSTKEVLNQNLKKFDLDFLVDDFSQTKQNRLRKADAEGRLEDQPELYRYSLDDLILRSDGGVVLIAEQYYVYERSSRDFYTGNFTTDYYYNYNDIIVVNIRPTGEIEWASRIPKRQLSINDGGYFSSYAMSIIRDKIYFVFNDNARNFNDAGREGRLYNFNGSNSVVALAEVAKNGAVKVDPLFKNREASITTRPKVCKQVDKREMVIYGERNRRYRFAHLEFLLSSKS